MRIINLSLLRLNDHHSYYGGAIGSIGYELLSSIASIKNIEVISFSRGTDLIHPINPSLKLITVDSFNEVKNLIGNYTDDSTETILSHLYFHEPEYTPLAKFAKDSNFPFLIGMCETPHPRLSDEVNGILKSPTLRKIGKSFLYMPKFKKTLSSPDRLITVNEHAKQYYSNNLPIENIGVIPYGVNQNIFSHAEFPTSPRILVVSRLIQRRNIDSLINALPIIIKEVPDVQIDIVGEGPQRSILEYKSSQNGTKPYVHFHGNVSAEQLVALYKSCTVFCHLSQSDGWNQPALEAMATGRPVISMNEPHNSMIIDGITGYLLHSTETSDLSEKLIQILSDTKLSSQMGNYAYDIVSTNYSLDVVSQKYAEEFRSLI